MTDIPENDQAAEQESPEPLIIDDKETSPQRSRRELIADRQRQNRRNRPFVYGGLLIFLVIIAIPAYAFYQEFVSPPNQLAVRIVDTEFTQGDVVDFLRFQQRLSEQAGEQFSLGTSLFEAYQVISDNEIAFQGAVGFGISVSNDELDEEIRGILGYGFIDPEFIDDDLRVQIEEAQFQFLNAVQFTETQYRDMVRKEIFRRKVRDAVSESVPRIQEQVHLYQIVLETFDEDLRDRIDKRVKAGENFSDLAFEYSAAEEVQRHGGDEGWLPRGITPEIDPLFFDNDESGERYLPIRTVSEMVHIPAESKFGVLYIDEYAAARPVDNDPLELLKDIAFTSWLRSEQRRLDTFWVLNSEVTSWVGEQVILASVLETPTPAPPTGQYTLDDQGRVVPATLP